MVKLLIFIFGLIFGSFIGATTWRLHKFRKTPKKIYQGRSICENCKHELSPLDLFPLLSYLFLKGKCRYCGHKIGGFAPFIESFTGLIFILNYIYWPYGFEGIHIIYFALWLLMVVGFLILALYDFRWKTLPSSVIYITAILSILGLLVYIVSTRNYSILFSRIWGVLIGGGIFWVIYQISNGQWIGGGDVRIGFLLGLIVGGPLNILLMLFISSVSGLIYSLPMMFLRKFNTKTQIPFGPFLILGCVVIFLYGERIISYLKNSGILPIY